MSLERDSKGRFKADHGLSKHPIYKIWSGIISRCYYENSYSFPWYGGKGIKLCDEWKDFMCFYYWAIEGWETGLTINRVDSDKGYYPKNCNWIPFVDQTRGRKPRKDNKSGYPGVSSHQGKWRVRIQINKNKRLDLGSYVCLNKAIEVKKAAEQKYWRD